MDQAITEICSRTLYLLEDVLSKGIADPSRLSQASVHVKLQKYSLPLFNLIDSIASGLAWPKDTKQVASSHSEDVTLLSEKSGAQ